MVGVFVGVEVGVFVAMRVMVDVLVGVLVGEVAGEGSFLPPEPQEERRRDAASKNHKPFLIMDKLYSRPLENKPRNRDVKGQAECPGLIPFALRR
jgi:hypothetical protein